MESVFTIKWRECELIKEGRFVGNKMIGGEMPDTLFCEIPGTLFHEISDSLLHKIPDCLLHEMGNQFSQSRRGSVNS